MARTKLAAADKLEGAERLPLLTEAQSYLRRAMEANPTDYRTYLLLAKIRSTAPSYPNVNDVATLKLALSYAPQVTGLRVQTADALRKIGRPEEAMALMAVLQGYTHDGAPPPGEQPSTPQP